MPSIGLFFFTLGLVAASLAANGTTELFTTSAELGSNDFFTSTPNIAGDITRTNDDITAITTSDMNVTDSNSTMLPLTTQQEGKDMSLTTRKPMDTSKSLTTPTGGKDNFNNKGTSAQPNRSTAGDSIGIIILVVIIIIAVAFGVVCFFIRKRGRRYSIDFTSRPDEANIPLSTMEPVDTVPQNGLQTFESTETTKEPQEPEAKPEVQEEQKAEADKSVVDPSAESAPPAPSPDSSEDKPKEDVAEQSPPAPVEPTVEEKTDDEGVNSNKTSVESLKESNENNSNNADFSQRRDLKMSNIFWDIPLDCPV